MNKKYKLFLLIVFIFSFVPYWASAQNKGRIIVVSSVLTDRSGKALEGVNIMNDKGAVIGTTGPTGSFSVKIPADGRLQIDHKGFKSIQVPADNVPDKIALFKVPFLMDEANKVPILFGEIKRRETVGVSYTLNPSEFFKYDNVRSLSGAINGRIPGMLGSNNIRGIGSPLFLIDGLPRDISDINIEEIDRITVLKDANSSILYGTQAANGVVQITTKRGQAYRQKLNVIAEKGIGSPIALPHYLSSADYMKYRNQAAVNDGLSVPYSQGTIDDYASGKNPYRYPNIDYYSDEFLKSFLNQSRVGVEFSGGNKTTRYYTNLGWTNQGSLYKIGDAANTSSNRFNIRSNVDINVTDFIKAYIGVAMVFNADKNPAGNFWSDASTIQPHRYPQLLPLSLISDGAEISDGSSLANAFKSDGKYILGGTTLYKDNIYGNQSFGSYSTNIDRSLQYTQGLAVDLDRYVKGLNFNAAISFDVFNSFQQGVTNTYAVYEPVWTSQDSISYLTKVGADLRSGTQTASGAYFQRRTNIYAAFDYHRDLGNGHHLSGTLLGYFDQTRREDLLVPGKDAHLGARISYNYAGKYLADFSSAYVNGYKLPQGNRGGFSPSLGLAWVISDEDFLSSVKQIDYLKIRASAGIINYEPSGNDYSMYNQTFGTYNGSFSWDDGVRSITTRTLNHAANSALGFQKVKDFNLGFEGYFFNQALFLDANMFLRKKAGLVVQRSTYPGYLAGNIPYENHDETDYKGVEAGMIWKLGGKKLGLDIGANILYSTSNRVKVDEMQSEGYLNRQGKPADAMFGLEAIGLFDSWQTIQNSPEQAFTAVQPGDIRYKDQNNDGIINADDVVFIGNSQARLSFGLSILARYKNISLFALGTARQGGYDYYNDSYYWVQGEDKYSAEVVPNSWTEETKATATYPRLSYGNNTNNFRNSTFWLYKNDFFRLERVQINFDMPSKISNTLFSKNISVFLRGENLLRLSKDAEKRQLVIGRAPNYRNFLLGLKVKF